MQSNKKNYLLVMALLGMHTTHAISAVTSQGTLLLEDVLNNTLSVKPLLLREQKLPWTSGFWAIDRIGKKGSLGIEISGFDSAYSAGDSLVIEQGFPGLERIRVKRCAGGSCELQKVEQKSQYEFNVSLGYATIKIRDYGAEACEPGQGSCRHFLPSWAIQALGSKSHSGLPNFPKILVVRQTTHAIQFFNAETGSLFQELKGEKGLSPFSLGTMREVHLDDNGHMSLQFDKGAMLLDWVNDLILIGDDTGSIGVSEGGIGASSIQKIKQVHQPSPQLTLMLGSTFIINSKQILRYFMNFMTPFKLLETYQNSQEFLATKDIGEGKVALLSNGAHGETIVSHLKVFETLNIEESSRVPFSMSSSKKTLFAGEAFFRASGNEWQIFGKNRSWEGLIVSEYSSQFQVVGSNYFSLRPAPSEPGTNDCEWTRFLLNESSISIEDSFMRFPCSAQFEATHLQNTRVMALGHYKTTEEVQGTLKSHIKTHWKVWWP